MAYLGRQPNTGVRSRYIYTATASQTTFSGTDDDGKTLKYEDAAYVDVFLNGVLLKPVTDYAATTKTSVVLTSAAAASDIVEIVAYDIANIADTVSAANGGAFGGTITAPTVKVGTLQTTAGATPRAEDLGIDISGTLVQMQYTTAQTNTSFTSSTKVEIVSVSITPRFSDSKLKVTFHGDWQQNSGNDAHLWLSRDDGSGIYNAITDGSWSTTASNDTAMWQYFYRDGSNAVKDAEQVFVVDAKVTQQITFKAWGGSVGGGQLAIGANNRNQQLIVEEIAQ